MGGIVGLFVGPRVMIVGFVVGPQEGITVWPDVAEEEGIRDLEEVGASDGPVLESAEGIIVGIMERVGI